MNRHFSPHTRDRLDAATPAAPRAAPVYQARTYERLARRLGVDPSTLPADAERTLWWLAGWDRSTEDGVVDLFAAAIQARRGGR